MGADNIILIGFMGSGKSVIGRRLAKQMKYRFMDTDKIIVDKEGMEIQEIFKKYGEERFRDLESSLLLSMIDNLDRTVLSTGGGMPVRESNVKLLHAMGKIIYLRSSQNAIVNRLSGDTTRPLLEGGSLEEKVEKLLHARAPIYEKAADIIIDTDGKSIDDIVKEIIIIT